MASVGGASCHHWPEFTAAASAASAGCGAGIAIACDDAYICTLLAGGWGAVMCCGDGGGGAWTNPPLAIWIGPGTLPAAPCAPAAPMSAGMPSCAGASAVFDRV